MITYGQVTVVGTDTTVIDTGDRSSWPGTGTGTSLRCCCCTDRVRWNRLYLIGGCGHWTMIERSAEFLGVVTPFLSES